MYRIIPLTIIIAVLFACCNTPRNGSDTDASITIKKMVGEWHAPTGYGFGEYWQLDDDTLLTGMGFKLHGTEKKPVEHLAIVERNHDIYYMATVKGQNEGKTIPFLLRSFSDTTLVFQNPGHDFPQRISYYFMNDSTFTVKVESFEDDERNFMLIMSRK